MITTYKLSICNRLNLNYWSNLLLLVYIFTMPLVSGFAFTPLISLSLIISVILFNIMIIQVLYSLKLPHEFIGIDILTILFLIFVVAFSFFLNGLGISKSFNHAVAYLSTFLLFYIGVKFILFNTKDKKRLFIRVLQILTITTIFNAVYANIEFISSNFFGVNLNDYIPRPNAIKAFYNATVLKLFYRARGFAPESGHFAFMMELFTPLTIYYMYFSGFCLWSKFFKALIVLLILFSFLFAVSTASFAVIPASILVASTLYIKRIYLYLKNNLVKFIISASIISILLFLINTFFSIYELIKLSIDSKVTSGSFYDRKARLDFFYNNFAQLDFIHKIVGTGPAGYEILGVDETNAILSLYHSVTFELGFLGLLLLLLLFVYFGLNTLRIKSSLGYFLTISLSSGMMHYYFISNFWYPWFWFIAAFAIFCTKFISSTAYTYEDYIASITPNRE